MECNSNSSVTHSILWYHIMCEEMEKLSELFMIMHLTSAGPQPTCFFWIHILCFLCYVFSKLISKPHQQIRSCIAFLGRADNMTSYFFK